ncbi:MAG TPA: glycosyltransferase, partial [Hyphomicrobiaceae bacterium]|nr:glycosyltransferase [Hyphomicrobiaceae bacterium]
MAQPTTKDHAKVSVVFVTYDRLETLKPTVESFLSLTNYPRDRLELILSDDASPAAVRLEFAKLAVDKIVVGEMRSGIGANQNRGITASTGDFILQIQDDWICQGPP